MLYRLVSGPVWYGLVLVLVPVLVSCLKNARSPFMRSVNISDYARPPTNNR